ncbi:MAG: acyl-CoA thioesterase [Alicyclobacillaceae bacterium]|nr:acyl-CoA thioesterase [Alicyclobacillaceae bacterium]
MDGFRFAYPLRVRWAEVDAQGIVFNANYLTYLDCAFFEYLRSGLGVDPGSILHTVIVKTTLEFHRPARFDDALNVWVRTKALGRTSLTLQFVISREDERLLDAETVYVNVDPASGRPAPVPDEWRERICAVEGI